MGLVRVAATLRSLRASNGALEADFLVDTDATDSVAPSSSLREIGVEPIGARAYELADGTRQEFEFGLAEIEILGEVTAGRILFGADGAEPVLGVTALESAGFTVDPTTQQPRKLPAIPLK